jgi:hypothetical protein
VARIWSIATVLVQRWTWRCLSEDIVVPGSELCVATPDSGHLVGLAESGQTSVDQDQLRHRCGSQVRPVTLIEEK